MRAPEAVRRWISGWRTFHGRAGRAEMAWVMVVHGAAIAVLWTVSLAGFGGIAAYAGLAWIVVTLVPTLSLVWRRLHDLDTSGWWGLAFLPLMALLVFLPLAMLLAGLALSAIPGTPARNRFGPRPGDREMARTFD